SGLTSGVLIVSTISPPAALKRSANTRLASAPGAQSDWTMTALFAPFCADHVPRMADDCASVKLTRTTKGELSVRLDVPEIATTLGTLAAVASGAMANADGVRPPTRIRIP